MASLGKKWARATFTSSPAASSSRSAWRMSGRFCSSCAGTPTPARMFRSKNRADMRSTGCGKRLSEEVDTVLGLDDLLPNDQLFALVLANLGLETLDRQRGAAACFHLGLGDLEALLLKRDDLIQSLKPFVERHQPVIILGNLGDQTGHEVVPPLSGGEVALLCRVPGIAQFPPDIQLPEEVQA